MEQWFRDLFDNPKRLAITYGIWLGLFMVAFWVIRDLLNGRDITAKSLLGYAIGGTVSVLVFALIAYWIRSRQLRDNDS